MTSATQWLVEYVNRRGYVLLVDMKGQLRYYPTKIDKALLARINTNATRMKYWLVTDAVTQA